MCRRGSDRRLQKLRWRWRACLAAGFPWFLRARLADKHIMVDVRRIVRRQFGRDHHPLFRILAQILVAIVWPSTVFNQLWKIRRFAGPEVVSIKRVPGAIWVSLRHNISPGEYLAYSLWKPDRRASIDHYLYSNEAPRLFKVLNRPSQPDPIHDKLAFYETCKAHAVPTPAVLATFSPTGEWADFGPCQLPAYDLFIKPQSSFAGEGAERFRWHESAFESNRGRWIKPQDLNQYLATRARNEQRTLLVQPLLSNHPSLGVARDEPLATARLVTGLLPDGEAIPILGFIYYGKAQRITAQHGLVAVIDVAHGRVMEDSTGTRSYQLGSRAVVLPDWPAVLRYAEVVHRACSHCIFVGWDIAFTDAGPMFLEGNENWSAEEYQALTGQPLGSTKFADVLGARWPGAGTQKHEMK